MNNAAPIIESIETFVRAVPFPVLIIVGFIVLVVIGQLKGAPKKPTEIVGYDEAAQRERLRQMQLQQSFPQGQPVPPPIPSQRQKKQQRGRNQRLAQETARAAQAAAAARAQAAAIAARQAAAASTRAAETPAVAPKRPTIASNARTFFNRGGLTDAFILGEILNKPKSAE